VREVYGLDLAETDLVVLSACETALGGLSDGDDVVGLTRAFLAAGAPAVVTTLWSIDDDAGRDQFLRRRWNFSAVLCAISSEAGSSRRHDLR